MRLSCTMLASQHFFNQFPAMVCSVAAAACTSPTILAILHFCSTLENGSATTQTQPENGTVQMKLDLMYQHPGNGIMKGRRGGFYICKKVRSRR